MSTHIVNWLLPEPQWESLLTRLFGGQERARACLLALSIPAETGHLLAAHQEVVEAALSVRGGAELGTAAADLASRIGTLYGEGTPAARAMPYEDPAQAAALVQALAASSDLGRSSGRSQPPGRAPPRCARHGRPPRCSPPLAIGMPSLAYGPS
ncbi:hypothetical protein FRZ03_28130 [Streptomyces misionensis]|uniref:Uncharacterized protein n=1 Tax=Streptomyces misionensis TaxID=67331 RepID=A0A5C6J040_9ACTN|nr:hypothetical protein [Streptomyces misionensis]TWV34736.1 hypothetical protein FRZ03_28130 [Streptomyces misionensis]